MPPNSDDGSGFIQEDDDDNRTKTSSLPSLRSDADIVDGEGVSTETGQYGFSIIEILTKTTRLVHAVKRFG